MSVQPTPDSSASAAEGPAGLRRDDGKPSTPRFFYMAATAALVIAGLHYGQALLMPLATAALLAFVLDPLVAQLRRWRVPMFAAVTLVVTLAVTAVAASGVLVVQQVAALGQDLPQYQSTIRDKLHRLRLVGAPSEALQGASRVLAVVESEIDAARAALGTSPADGKKNRPVTRVQVEAAPVPPMRALSDMVSPLLTPLASVGLVVVLLAYMLAQRRQVSDRLVRLMGGDIHRVVNLLGDAGTRVSRFLVTQLCVNLGFGFVLAVGLWLVGVPAAWLWGGLAALLRFVPYLGILIAAAFPLTVAFAVDPGWDMVVWTAALILVVELLIANVVEPLAYSGSTGVSPAAVLLSAAFWVLIWGPMGLVLATPLTVCLVVLGRHLGALRFLDVLLGTEPAFERPTVLYQRLIADDHEEAVEWSLEEMARSQPADFYAQVGLPMLVLASSSAQRGADAEQRYRLQRGTTRVLDELKERHPPAQALRGRVLCIGARHELDTLSAEMLAHALGCEGFLAQAVAAVAISADRIAALPLQGVQAVVLCTLQTAPASHARFVSRRLRQRQPGLHITLAAWSPTTEMIDSAAMAAMGVDDLAKTPTEVAARLSSLPLATAPLPSALATAAPVLGSEDPLRPLMARTAQRAAGIFRVPLVCVVLRAGSGGWWSETAGLANWTMHGSQPDENDGSPLAAVLSRNEALAFADVARVPEFAVQTGSRFEGLLAFAGVPLHDKAGNLVGALAVHDSVVREFSNEELELLQSMGRQLCTEVDQLRREGAGSAEVAAPTADRPAPGAARESGALPPPAGAAGGLSDLRPT